ncbi:MAG: 5-oxoprolinase subunit PxpB [Terriglobales bacterium]
MKIIHASDSSSLVAFGNAISPELHARVIGLFQALRARQDPRIRNMHPGYTSLLIDFDPLRMTHDELAEIVAQSESAEGANVEAKSNVVSVPVCYDTEFGPDLLDLAAHARLSPEEVIQIHSSATYLVYFLGFSPGFAYMGGLPEKLHMPRLPTPRGHVAAGTVGIAGSQTGVYPVDSAGGWRLIGRTPWRMFDPKRNPPTRLQPGDKVRFSPIDRAAFSAMAKS